MTTGQLAPGTLLNSRYEIKQVIGRGGMGTVYLALHRGLDEDVAIKEISAVGLKPEEREAALQQCRAEARFMVHFNHPNLPRVMDAFVENFRCYMVMEYINGVTLDQHFRDMGGGPLPVPDVISWAIQIAQVLSFLHQQEPPVIFRDMKPTNVMLEADGCVRLIDFGIARRFTPGASRDTALYGSAGYSPPEQFGLRQTDARADIYAFGATLHFLLTSRDPAIEPFKFPAAHMLNPLVPLPLSRLISSCVNTNPEKRPANMEEIGTELEQIERVVSPMPADGRIVTAAATRVKITSARLSAETRRKRESVKIPTVPEKAPPRTQSARRPAMVTALIVLCVCLLASAGFYAVYRNTRHTRHLPTPPLQANTAAPNGIAKPEPPTTDPQVSIPLSQNAEEISEVNQYYTKDAAGNVLNIHVTGRVHTDAGHPAKLVVFFTDADNNPLRARHPEYKLFATPTGDLAAAIDLISDVSDRFDAVVQVPLGEFPDNYSATAKLKCIILVNNVTVVTHVPIELLDPNMPGSTAPPAGISSSGTPASAPPSTSSPTAGLPSNGSQPAPASSPGGTATR